MNVKYDWNIINADFLSGKTQREIYEKYGCSPTAALRAMRLGRLSPTWVRKKREIPTRQDKEYSRRKSADHYRRYKERYLAKAGIARAKALTEIRKIILEALSGGCIDCGEKDIIVLEFDHIDRSTKKYTIAVMRNAAGIVSIRDEIKKCEIRCANCHRRKTARENGSWRLKVVQDS